MVINNAAQCERHYYLGFNVGLVKKICIYLIEDDGILCYIYREIWFFNNIGGKFL